MRQFQDIPQPQKAPTCACFSDLFVCILFSLMKAEMIVRSEGVCVLVKGDPGVDSETPATCGGDSYQSLQKGTASIYT